ncbi:hypothetical protein QVN42_01695 [Yersinia nurmii]|uniref:Lipoprotein n=1 Tax=Yersinia nurmii TaxID=685706 RepID=A0AAW7K5Q3_9GAMM|nr:hypothetical protein [Yersinia nurmii]MDN0086116.1 hypothetical protein [Yersinia nurmii]CND84530.1 Uncharacterised protein [Yersinia nurmii]
MNKFIFCVFLCALSGCSGGDRSELGKAPAESLDAQTCMDDISDANSDCAHSVEPKFN